MVRKINNGLLRENAWNERYICVPQRIASGMLFSYMRLGVTTGALNIN